MKSCGVQLYRDMTEAVVVNIRGRIDRGVDADKFYMELTALLRKHNVGGYLQNGERL